MELNPEIDILTTKLFDIDKERNKILSEISSLLEIESSKYKGKIIKLDKHKGFNWAYFTKFQISYGNEISVYMNRDGNRVIKNVKEVEIVDDDFKDIPLFKKIP